MTTPAHGYDADGLDGSWDGDHSDLPDLRGLDVGHFETAAAEAGEPPAPVQRAAPKLGTGARFAKLKSSLAAKGASDPGALAAWIGRRKYGKAKFAKLASKARSGGGASRSDGRGELIRDYPLEDLHIVRSEHGGDGRTVEAFAAVFNTETEIMDHQGHYIEVIGPTAFNKRLSDLRRSKAGFGAVKVIFNHGRSLDGVPVERFMMPCAKPLSIEATDRGLLTRSRYLDTPLGNEVLQLISEGAITSQSFVGKIVRSDPEPGRYGKYRPDASGRLPVVHRTELGLREYGSVVFAAYEGAEILGVRMSAPGTWEPDEHEEQALLPDGEAAAGEPLTPDGAEHSARYHQHALYVLRSKEAREKAGLVW